MEDEMDSFDNDSNLNERLRQGKKPRLSLKEVLNQNELDSFELDMIMNSNN